MYDSPQHDMGYDISDYESVYPPYGTVKDIETIIEACHSRGMKLVLDLVINHTSDEHKWFQESKSSKENPKRDWYIWRPARYIDGKRTPPTNWRSWFSGSTWEWDEHTQEYYLHLFAKQQPDLNWENPATRQAIYDSAMEFWLKRGVDGFRVDTVNMYSKGTAFEDAPIVDKDVFEQPAFNLFCNGPRMHEFLREMNTRVLNKYDAVTIGELPATPDPAHVLRYIGSGDKQLSMVFQFDIVDLGTGRNQKYEYEGFRLSDFKNVISRWQTFINDTDGWTTVFCENHDQGRAVSRYANDAPEWREKSAKMLALAFCAMTGTLFIYQGQEIGAVNVPREWDIKSYQDIEGVNYYNSVAQRTNNDEVALQKAMDSLNTIGRDNARVPMQWDASEHAGFTDKKEGPWMRVNDSYMEINVASQLEDPNSVLNFYRKMLKLRKMNQDLFIYGIFEGIDMGNEETFVFTKTSGNKKVVVALNFTPDEKTWGRENFGQLLLLVSSVGTGFGKEDILSGYEGRIYIVK